MINCILPTDSLVFAELRHFVNRFQTPLPFSWIHSPIKALTRLSCCLIGRIFSQVVLLALPHTLYSREGRPDQLTNSCTSFCAILPTSLCHSPTNIWQLYHLPCTKNLCDSWTMINNSDALWGNEFFSEFFLHWVQHEVTFLWTTRGVKRNSIDYLVLLNKEDAVTILLSRPQTLPF